jgi:hypothetical protein
MGIFETEVVRARREANENRKNSEANSPAGAGRTYTSTTNSSAPVNGRDAVADDRIPVRRPGFGVFPPKPTWTTLEIKSLVNGESVEIYNSCYKSGKGKGTTNFIVQNMRWTPKGATQIVRSYGDWYLSDTGENADILMVGGVLLESANFPWFREWLFNWDQYLRARRCILNRTEIRLTIDQVTWRGYMVNCEVGRQHSMQASWQVLPISFQLLLRGIDDNTVDGVQVGPAAEITAGENPIIEFYKEQFLDTAKDEFIFNSDKARSAFGLELIAGTSDDALRWDPPALEYPQTDEDMIYTLNIGRLTAIAVAANKAAGRQVFDLAKVRRGLISTQNAALAFRGTNSPYGAPGSDERYRDKTARQIENGADDAMSWTGNAVKDFLW